MPYSWDEPTLLPELSVGVQGAGSYMQYNMQDLGGGERLYYYNPIYVVFAHTFSRWLIWAHERDFESSFNSVSGWQFLEFGYLLGSASEDVFERCTSTGKGNFEFPGSGFLHTRDLKIQRRGRQQERQKNNRFNR